MIHPIVLGTAILVAFTACNDKKSKPDNDFDVSVNDPQLKSLRPRVLFDEAHKNHHKIETTYKPFAKLITNDGCVVQSTDRSIDAAALANTDIYIVATAMGKEDPGDQSPFLPSEIDQLEQWVGKGGSLLIITEHYPFGLAMSPLLGKFGVVVHNGYAEDSLLNNKDVRDALLFTKAGGHLNASHPILDHVERINTFTGSSVKGDSSWTKLLLFTDHAQNYNVKVEVKREGGDITTSVSYADFYPAKGYAQGICKEWGRGRVVVLAESAFLTAQFDIRGERYGMNSPNEDNKQFVLNLIRWLAIRKS